MPDRKVCTICSEEECLTTLGQFCLCTVCRKQVLEDALAFAKRNSAVGTLYHAAFEALHQRFSEETKSYEEA